MSCVAGPLGRRADLFRGTSALRHIRLLNTQEQKPITNSRDTQELMWDAGCEVLAIFSKFREKTSLLQDWGFHEVSRMVYGSRDTWADA